MDIRVFISHQQADSALARQAYNFLGENHKIECYLDLIDPEIKKGEDLAQHLREKLSDCTQLLAIVSHSTKDSWWVPWEIGVATEKDYPLATFGMSIDLPDYLKKWPYLKTMLDLDEYAIASKSALKHIRTLTMDSATATASGSIDRTNATKHFYQTLRSKLGQ